MKSHRIIRHLFAIFCFLMLCSTIHAEQVRILSRGLTAYTVDPESMMNLTLMNSGENIAISLEARLLNADGELLLFAKSGTFQVAHGVFATLTHGVRAEQFSYGSARQVSFIKARHVLPGGTYTLCYK